MLNGRADLLGAAACTQVVSDNTAVKNIDHIKDKKEAVIAMNVSILNIHLPELVGSCNDTVLGKPSWIFHLLVRLLL
ncbi:hypothetical protein D3C78_1464250 [compost metagenome]